MIYKQALEAATRAQYESFFENVIGCCEEPWENTPESYRHRLIESTRKAIETYENAKWTRGLHTAPTDPNIYILIRDDWSEDDNCNYYNYAICHYINDCWSNDEGVDFDEDDDCEWQILP